MVFGNDGKMYVANSRSYVSGIGDQGEILSIDSTGAQSVFVTDNLMRGPDALAFGDPGDAGGLGPLYVAIEDGDEAGVRANDFVLRVAGASASVFFDAYEPTTIIRGPGGAFGTNFYYCARTTFSNDPPNELRVFQRSEGGGGGVFTVTSDADSGGEIMGAAFLTWGTGGTLGTDMYMSTIADGAFTPGSRDAIYRVQPNGRAMLVADGYRALGVAASPAASGPFGDSVYMLGATSIDRVDSAGNITPVVSGLTQPTGIVFGPDGMLYVSEAGRQRILKVRPCAP
jgi:hypothetical protein